MSPVLLVVLVVLISSRTCESAALGASGPEEDGRYSPEDLEVIRELEEVSEKRRIAEDFFNRHKSEARVVPLDGELQEEEVGDGEEEEVFDNIAESLRQETATITPSSPTVNASVPAKNGSTSPTVVSPATFAAASVTSLSTGTTTTASALLEALASVLSNTTAPPTSNISTAYSPPQLGNEIDNALPPATSPDGESNVINPLFPGLNHPPNGNNIAVGGGLKAYGYDAEDNLLHPQPSQPSHSSLEPSGQLSHLFPEQPTGGDFLCPFRYYRLGRLCYRTSDQPKSFLGASQDCRADNGVLAIVKDPPTNRFLIQLIETYRPGESHWIGLSDMLQENVFVWSDAIPLEGTTFWARGQPNNLRQNQHCVYMYPPFGHQWVDGECSDQHYYICQQPIINSVYQIVQSYIGDIGAFGEPSVDGDSLQPTPSD